MWRSPSSSGEGQEGVWEFGGVLDTAWLGAGWGEDRALGAADPVLSCHSEYLMMLMPPSQEEEK